ncbi:hypothetical protein [Mesorhizobium sp. M0276]|uniref:hypothetical protein n=1 Tax=Mesorhizobium sp. M0276 TaxID=2956928 RepID=UPI00333D4FCF
MNGLEKDGVALRVLDHQIDTSDPAGREMRRCRPCLLSSRQLFGPSSRWIAKRPL